MDTNQFEELAGRIDGVAQALLRITAELEGARLIDGPRMSQALRLARRPGQACTKLQASRRVLGQIAQELDAARAAR